MFKLAPGRSINSFGLQCALQSGLPREIVLRAQSIRYSLRTGGQIDPIASVCLSEGERTLLQWLQRPRDWDAFSVREAEAFVELCQRVQSEALW